MSTSPKTVLITGASSGIGEATALRLADDGHRLFLGARRTERLEALLERIKAAEGTASFRRLDVTDAADVQQFVADATNAYGRVDVMINNAGVMPLSALAEDKVDEWNRRIDVNIRGVLHGISAALPVMRAQGSGHIINLAPSAPTRWSPPRPCTAPPSSRSGLFRRGCAKNKPAISGSASSRRESPNPNSPNRSQMHRPATRCENTAPLPFPRRRSPMPLRSPSGSPPRWTSTRSSSDRPPARTSHAAEIDVLVRVTRALFRPNVGLGVRPASP
jgi:NAD(P)-dependent dehydrogenase (short-subunit alcohol dehydrogenase family)